MNLDRHGTLQINIIRYQKFGVSPSPYELKAPPPKTKGHLTNEAIKYMCDFLR